LGGGEKEHERGGRKLCWAERGGSVTRARRHFLATGSKADKQKMQFSSYRNKKEGKREGEENVRRAQKTHPSGFVMGRSRRGAEWGLGSKNKGKTTQK